MTPVRHNRNHRHTCGIRGDTQTTPWPKSTRLQDKGSAKREAHRVEHPLADVGVRIGTLPSSEELSAPSAEHETPTAVHAPRARPNEVKPAALLADVAKLPVCRAS